MKESAAIISSKARLVGQKLSSSDLLRSVQLKYQGRTGATFHYKATPCFCPDYVSPGIGWQSMLIQLNRQCNKRELGRTNASKYKITVFAANSMQLCITGLTLFILSTNIGTSASVLFHGIKSTYILKHIKMLCAIC